MCHALQPLAAWNADNSGNTVFDDFPRIKRLPPYVFNIVNELKAQARRRGRRAGMLAA